MFNRDPKEILEEGYTLEEVLEFIEVDLDNNQVAFARFAKFGVPQHVIDRAVEAKKDLEDYRDELKRRIKEAE